MWNGPADKSAQQQIPEAGLQTRTIVPSSGCVVLMQVPVVDPGADEGVALQVHRLAQVR